MAINDKHELSANKDPITGEPGAHPLGTGVGSAIGGVAGIGAAVAAGAAAGTVAGPIGTAAGAVVGAIAGGLLGSSAGEKINPTEEDAYWEKHHGAQAYADDIHSYTDYAPAYRVGYLGVGRYPGREFDEIEPALRNEFEEANAGQLDWQAGRPAARAAWDRAYQVR